MGLPEFNRLGKRCVTQSLIVLFANTKSKQQPFADTCRDTEHRIPPKLQRVASDALPRPLVPWDHGYARSADR